MFSKEFDSLRRNTNAQRILELVANIVGILLVVGLVGVSSYQNIKTLRADNQEVQSLKVRLADKRENITQAEQQVQALGTTKILLEEAMPLAPKQFDLLHQVKKVAERYGMTVDQIQHKAGATGEVEFTVIGMGTYRQNVDFLKVLEALPRLIQVTSIQMGVDEVGNTSDPMLAITAIGKGYYYPEIVSLIRPIEREE